MGVKKVWKIKQRAGGWLAILLIAQAAFADKEITASSNSQALLGMGYRTDQERFKGECVAGTEDSAGQPQANVDFSQSLSQDQLARELGFNAGGRARFGAAEVSASAKFLKASTSNAYSLVAVYSGDYRFRNRILKRPTLSTLGQSVHQNVERFDETCGDEFVEQIVQGAKLFFSIRIDFSSQEEKDSFEASFSYKSTFAEAHASLKSMSKSFSKKSTVTVSAFQIGGEVDQVTGIFQGTSSSAGQALGFVQCTFGDFSKCDSVMANALSYATDLQNGFPSQLKRPSGGEDSGPANLLYLTKSYLTAGIYAAYPKEVGEAIKASRQDIERLFDGALTWLSRSRYLLYQGQVLLSPKQRKAMVKEEEKLAKNVEKLVSVGLTCYNTPLQCIAAAASLNPAVPGGLELVDETVFEIRPETFRQYCGLAQSVVATVELRDSIKGYISAAKEMAPTAFQSVDPNIKLDECLVSHQVFLDAESANFAGKGIKLLEPIAEYKHWKFLDLSNNKIGSVAPLANFMQLLELKLGNNVIRELSSLSTLEKLRILDASGNRLRDAQALSVLPELERVDLRDNLADMKCPESVSIKSCLIKQSDITGQFVSLGQTMKRAALYASAAEMQNDQVLISGLADSSQYHADSFTSALIFNKKQQQFTLAGTMAVSRAGHSSTTLKDGRVLVTGGWGGALKQLEIYNPSKNAFELLAIKMKQGRAGHTSTLLPDGRVLIAGGYSEGVMWTGSSASYTAEIFDPQTGLLSAPIAMKSPRAWHTATLLSDGRVLLAGGYAADAGITSLEIFDPIQNSFSWVKPALREGRGAHTATLLPDGRVALAGGFVRFSQAVNTVEIYDPSAETIKTVYEKMNQARGAHSATLVADGKIVFVGGSKEIIIGGNFSDDCSVCLAVAETFDPAEESFRRMPSEMSRPRSNHVAIPISAENILFVGGLTWSAATHPEMLTLKF